MPRPNIRWTLSEKGFNVLYSNNNFLPNQIYISDCHIIFLIKIIKKILTSLELSIPQYIYIKKNYRYRNIFSLCYVMLCYVMLCKYAYMDPAQCWNPLIQPEGLRFCKSNKKKNTTKIWKTYFPLFNKLSSAPSVCLSPKISDLWFVCDSMGFSKDELLGRLQVFHLHLKLNFIFLLLNGIR